MQKQSEQGVVGVEALQFLENHFRGLQRIYMGDAEHLAVQGAFVASAYSQGQSDAYLSAANQIMVTVVGAVTPSEAEEEPRELPYSKKVLAAALDHLDEGRECAAHTAWLYDVDAEDLYSALIVIRNLRGGESA